MNEGFVSLYKREYLDKSESCQGAAIWWQLTAQK